MTGAHIDKWERELDALKQAAINRFKDSNAEQPPFPELAERDWNNLVGKCHLKFDESEESSRQLIIRTTVEIAEKATKYKSMDDNDEIVRMFDVRNQQVLLLCLVVSTFNTCIKWSDGRPIILLILIWT